jgi:hypothetical protein
MEMAWLARDPGAARARTHGRSPRLVRRRWCGGCQQLERLGVGLLATRAPEDDGECTGQGEDGGGSLRRWGDGKAQRSGSVAILRVGGGTPLSQGGGDQLLQ